MVGQQWVQERHPEGVENQVKRRPSYAKGLIIVVGVAVAVAGTIAARELRFRSEVARQSRTVAVLRTVATLLERQHERDGVYPGVPGEETRLDQPSQHEEAGGWMEPVAWPLTDAQTLDRLLPILDSKYHDALRQRDAWGRRLLYGVSADRQHYTLMSLGNDGKVDPDHIEEFPHRDVWRDLVVVEGGLFASAPDGLFLHFRRETARGR